MRVARCSKRPRSLSRNDDHAGADSDMQKGAVARPFLPEEDTSRAFEEALEEIERLGGDNVSVLTNDVTLSTALAVG